jgi:two-component system phosphate regulon response regulator OmpR
MPLKKQYIEKLLGHELDYIKRDDNRNIMNTDKNHILIVDDDTRIRELLKKYLLEHGLQVTTASSALEAQEILKTKSIDLMVLDNLMPGQKGVDYMKDLRANTTHRNRRLPVLMLTALNGVDDRIEGLENGANDYLGKPFEPRELLLRIHNLLARTSTSEQDSTILMLGAISYDFGKQALFRDETPIYLTSAEQALLQIFVLSPGSVLSRDELASLIGVSLSPRTVDVQITRLRRKIEPNPKQPLYLKTVRHKGYMLCPD